MSSKKHAGLTAEKLSVSWETECKIISKILRVQSWENQQKSSTLLAGWFPVW